MVDKLLEGNLRDKILQHLEREGLMIDSQALCIENRASQILLSILMKCPRKSIDAADKDFSKAFHKVLHSRLT